MKKTFNELDQWVIKNWIESRQLEDSMIEVREKYESVCDRIIDAVKEEQQELDNCRIRRKGEALIFSKKKWLSKWETWPSGLWIWNISLDKLMADDADVPGVGIQLLVPKGITFDLKDARAKIQNASVKLMNGINTKYLVEEDDSGLSFWHSIPEPRKELTQMLLDDESEKFVECIASHVKILTRFIPVLDEILLTKKP